MASITRVGSEILVNTATSIFQNAPQITALSNGGFVATWQDNSQGVGGATGDSSGFAVKAQVFAAGGAPVGSEILVNTATANDQTGPQITALSNGGFVATWKDGSGGVGGATGDASSFAVKAQVFAAGGTPVGTEILVNTATAGIQDTPQITALSNGGFVVTWDDTSHGVGGATGDTSGDAVKAQVFAAGGTPVGSEILVNTATVGNQVGSQITALSGGGFVVTWFDGSQGVGGATGDTSGNAVKAQVFAAGGAPVGSEILVNTATLSDQTHPQITALSNGGFVVTWWDGSEGVGGATGDASFLAIKAQVFAAGGTPVGSEIRVNTATSSIQDAPQITALSGGGFVVTWEDFSQGVGGATGDADGGAIKAQVFAAGGAPVGSEIRVNTATANDQTLPQIAALSNGGFVVTWQDLSQGAGGATGDASGAAVKAQGFAADGTPIGGEMLVNTATANDQTNSQITALSGGGFVVTWEDLSQGVGGATGDTSSYAVKAQVFAIDEAPTVATSGGTTAAFEQIAVAVDPGVTVADVDNATLASATVAITGGFHSGEDLLAFTNNGATMGNIAGNYVAGTGILTLTSAGASATLAQWQGALHAVTYTDTSDTPNTASRIISFVVNDGTAASLPSTKTVSVAAVDDPPVAHNDAFATPETTALGGGSLFADNGAGADSDPDGGPAFSVISVNGNAANVGSQTTLASGAHLTVNANGTFNYDPNHVFDYLAAGDSGASNTPGTEQFTYAITGGSTATVTVTISGVDSDDILQGTAGPDTLIAGIGNDTLNGLAGDDTLIGGAGADALVGGPGSDTASYTSSALAGVTVNLATGFASGGHAEGDTLSSIENLTGGPQADVLTGDNGDNVLNGGPGADTMTGAAGNDTYFVDNAADAVIENPGEGSDTVDAFINYGLGANVENLSLQGGADLQGYGNTLVNTLTGNSGNNLLDGGSAADLMIGGDGNDTYFVDNIGDAITENANQGNDTAFATVNYGLSANVENLILQGGADLQGYGNGLVNTLYGNTGANLLNGFAGADLMVGGAGNDTYFVDDPSDAVFESPNEGSDAVFSTANYGLAADVETLVLLGTADLQGYGNNQANVLYGNTGNNLLNGAGGVDLMVGGIGNDTYFVDDSSDAAFENPGEGSDTVFSTAHYGLAADVETLVLQGTADLQGYGNNQANTLYGNTGNNLLNGAGGADTMLGGIGNDTYFVDDGGDVVFENPGEGTDAVFATISYTLPANVEALVLQGSGNLAGTGNGLANSIFGNAGDNVLDGGANADVLTGNAGNDTFVFHVGQAGGDTIVDFAGNGTAPGDSLQLVGYGVGATFTQNDATHWQVNYNGGTSHEVIAFMNGAAIDPTDVLFS